MTYSDIFWRRDFCPPPSVGPHRAQISPSNSADEVEAIAALISLPSFGTESAPQRLSPKIQPVVPNYKLCFSAVSRTVHSSSDPFPLCHSSSFGSQTSTSSSDSSSYGCSEYEAGPWYTGRASLALPEDDDALSPLHGFMRKYCIEVFSATPQDVATPRYGKSHAGRVVVGQVGIRCLHCSHLDPLQRPERAVCYPSTLRNIYHSMETWQRRHSALCTQIPPWVRREMAALLKHSRSSAGGRRQYWEDAARQIGLVNTPHGVRFSRPPGWIQSLPHMERKKPLTPKNTPFAIQRAPTIHVVQPNDRELVTDYLYLLMEQMQVCYFAEEDRTGGRSKVKTYEIGFPGMQCQHCSGKAGFGRYFPSTVDGLALANSDRNIYNHLLKCRKCPNSIQEKLTELRLSNETAKNKRGSRKIFFERVWDRIHNAKGQNEST
jgi:hypothetical protein